MSDENLEPEVTPFGPRYLEFTAPAAARIEALGSDFRKVVTDAIRLYELYCKLSKQGKVSFRVETAGEVSQVPFEL